MSLHHSFTLATCLYRPNTLKRTLTVRLYIALSTKSGYVGMVWDMYLISLLLHRKGETVYETWQREKAWANVSELHFQLWITDYNLQSITADDVTLNEAFILNTEATKQMNDFFAQHLKASHPNGEGEFPLPGLSSAPRTHRSEASTHALVAIM